MSPLTELTRVANGRDHISTSEFANAIGRTGQTIRKNLCVEGAAYGIRPRKIKGRLLWPVAEISTLLAANELGN